MEKKRERREQAVHWLSSHWLMFKYVAREQHSECFPFIYSDRKTEALPFSHVSRSHLVILKNNCVLKHVTHVKKSKPEQNPGLTEQTASKCQLCLTGL